MTDKNCSTPETYDPDRLLDAVSEKLETKNDAALAQKLNIARTVLGAIRKKKMPVTASLLLWIHQETGIKIDELRELMGDRRAKLRFGRGSRSSVEN
jgi:transcriptional regulator with XRE-family HTH domain